MTALNDELRKVISDELVRQQSAPEIDLEYADASQGMGVTMEVHGDIDLASLAVVVANHVLEAAAKRVEIRHDVGIFGYAEEFPAEGYRVGRAIRGMKEQP